MSTIGGLRRRIWPDDRDGRHFSVGVGMAMIVGLAIRVAFVLIRQSEVVLTTGDAYWYHFQAKLLVDGKGFLNPFLFFKDGQVGPGADHPPGFVIVLAVLDKLGIDTPQGQRLAMCLVGTGSIWLIALLGRRIANVQVGIIAAVIAAAYPNLWINDGMLMVETVYIFAIAASLLGAYRYLSRPNRVDLLVVAAGLTVGSMTRPESLVLFGVFLLPMVLLRHGVPWRERILQVAIAALLPILTFGPWIAYNLGRFEQPVTVSSGSGQTLAAGNCVYTYDGPALGYYDIRCLLAPTIVEPTGDPSERDAGYRTLALDFMSEHRGELPKVMAARVGRLWHLYAPIQSLVLDGFIEGRSGGRPNGSRTLVGAAVIMYFVLLPFAVSGAVVQRRRRVPIWPLMVQPALASFVAALTFGITRYRAGAEITLVVLAAVALGWIWDRVRERRRRDAATTIPTGDDPNTPGDPIVRVSLPDSGRPDPTAPDATIH